MTNRPTLPVKNQLVVNTLSIQPPSGDYHIASGCFISFKNEQFKFSPIVTGPQEGGVLARSIYAQITAATMVDPSIQKVLVQIPKGTRNLKDIKDTLQKYKDGGVKIEVKLLKKYSPEALAIMEVLDRELRKLQ